MTKSLLSILSLSGLLLLPSVTWAQAAEKVPYQNERLLLLGFSIFLLIIVVVLAKTVHVSAQIKRNKIRQSKQSANKGTVLSIALLLGMGLLPAVSHASEAAAEEIKQPNWLTQVPADIYILSFIILVELIAVFLLAKVQLGLISDEKAVVEKGASAKKESRWKNFFIKVNSTVAVEDEHQLDLNHDYDGIKELDNRIPKWWLYSFYGTILFGFIYMYRMFISETLPDQFTELEHANIAAELKIKEYLKDAANNVDENTVVMMDAAGIETGKALFMTYTCNTCHGDNGEGNAVGPNLTDEYWLHKGSVKDIFYSIKYGWPEKGMKSWKDDMSPVQMAQIASYIKSLQGSNPANAKAPQGELYTEEAAEQATEDNNTGEDQNTEAEVVSR